LNLKFGAGIMVKQSRLTVMTVYGIGHGHHAIARANRMIESRVVCPKVEDDLGHWLFLEHKMTTVDVSTLDLLTL